MAERGENNVVISSSFTSKLLKWRVKEGQEVKERSVLALYEKLGPSHEQKGFITQPKLRSNVNGRIKKLLVAEGDVVPACQPVLEIEQTLVCEHNTVMKDLCCDCGMDLRKLQIDQDEPSSPTLATVSMIHNIPELKVTQYEAEAVGKKDEERLLNTHKLALVVDLDQTMIHTTIELVPADMKGVYHFNLTGYPLWYHTKFRPFAHEFLERLSKLFELHIFTMGSRMYAHTIARMLDPDESLFGHRIRSRDDCFNAFSKSNDLRSLFPLGDSMVCIIDDRADVWNNAPNLIKVKPYQFFKGVGDINAPSDKQHETAPDSDEMESQKENEKEDKIEDSSKETEVKQDDTSDADGSNNKVSEDTEKDDKEDKEKMADGSHNKVSEDTEKGDKEDKEKMAVSSSGKEDDSCDSNNVEQKNKETIQFDIELVSSLEGNKCVEESQESCKDSGKSEEKESNQTVDSNEEANVACKSENALESNHNNKAMEVESEVVDSEKEAEECNTSIEEQRESKNEATNLKAVDPQDEEKQENNENLGNGMEAKTTCKNIDKGVEMQDDSKDKGAAKDSVMCNNNNGNNGNESKTHGEGEKEEKNTETKENGTLEVSKTGETDDAKQDHVDDDDYLVHLEDILRRIHDKFYSTVDQIKKLKAKGIKEADSNIARYCSPGTLNPCTKQIIKELQSEVLKGANVVFTGVIPTNASPDKSEIWQRTERFGAKVSRNVVCPKDTRDPSDVTTHVIAARLGTEKTYRAIKTPGIKLVRPDWLWCCEQRWEWVDERLFPVDGVDKYKKEVRHQRTPQGTPQGWKKRAKNENNIDDDGDKFVTNTDKSTRDRTSSSSSADVLMASLHPSLAFSSTEMEAMDKEVEELMNSSSEESDVIGSISGSSSSASGSRRNSSSSSSSSSSIDDKDKDPTKKRKIIHSDSDDNSTKKCKEGPSDESDDYTRCSSPSDDDDDDGDDEDDEDDMAALLEAELSHD